MALAENVMRSRALLPTPRHPNNLSTRSSSATSHPTTHSSESPPVPPLMSVFHPDFFFFFSRFNALIFCFVSSVQRILCDPDKGLSRGPNRIWISESIHLRVWYIFLCHRSGSLPDLARDWPFRSALLRKVSAGLIPPCTSFSP